MSASKQRGTRWESAIVAYLREHGWPHAERRPLAGKHDRGDVAGVIGCVIEAKNQARHSWSEWLDEAEVEKSNDGADVGVVWAHRRGKASPADGYVVMTGAQFVELLQSAGYGSAPTADDPPEVFRDEAEAMLVAKLGKGLSSEDLRARQRRACGRDEETR